MKFSVLMSLYEKEVPKYFDECLKSIYEQSHKADEIVIVLDGPVLFEHREIISFWMKFLPIKVFHLELNEGLGKALNYGLTKCKYELVARMDTDDICLPDRFEKQLIEFEHDSDLVICGSSIKEVDAETLEFISNRNVPLSDFEIKSLLPFRSPFNHMTVMYKKSVIEKCGSYQHLALMEDWYLWCRLLALGGKSKNLSERLVIARTGLAMIERRTGWNYVQSEWKMHKVRCNLSLTGWMKSLCIFFSRSLVRVMPKLIVKKIYFKIRQM